MKKLQNNRTVQNRKIQRDKILASDVRQGDQLDSMFALLQKVSQQLEMLVLIGQQPHEKPEPAPEPQKRNFFQRLFKE